ncbi:hypothetical protein AMJ39_06865 [candidate division TA06 bacterium DG_24]|jgi:hypothetical protein|uniref:Uncharacterized protein n=3 Tax=Bacteria division TA06 TaxID=1156500 RepID=A0A0S8JHF3_UNCT6|nr:MAG: hypothetical protein AMJ39_06865 [candidate division TA06 bacterium DG_24]KPK68542.1 MAG: hypothetical protein AMJ82_07965 [candidate division TA06 bacterium SM23_40]KPL09167.1 MAG: hypothetical protein AMJ71_07160 [candidate division TA06 bacterium SM1_40]
MRSQATPASSRPQSGVGQKARRKQQASDYDRIADAYEAKYGKELTTVQIARLSKKADGSRRSADEVIEAIEKAPRELGKKPWQWIMQRLYGWSLWPDEVRELREMLRERRTGEQGTAAARGRKRRSSKGDGGSA